MFPLVHTQALFDRMLSTSAEWTDRTKCDDESHSLGNVLILLYTQTIFVSNMTPLCYLWVFPKRVCNPVKKFGLSNFHIHPRRLKPDAYLAQKIEWKV